MKKIRIAFIAILCIALLLPLINFNLEKNYALFFTSKAQHVRHVLRDCAEGLGERISFQRLIYLFLE